jgi:hypothetical protein
LSFHPSPLWGTHFPLFDTYSPLLPLSCPFLSLLASNCLFATILSKWCKIRTTFKCLELFSRFSLPPFAPICPHMPLPGRLNLETGLNPGVNCRDPVGLHQHTYHNFFLPTSSSIGCVLFSFHSIPTRTVSQLQCFVRSALFLSTQ